MRKFTNITVLFLGLCGCLIPLAIAIIGSWFYGIAYAVPVIFCVLFALLARNQDGKVKKRSVLVATVISSLLLVVLTVDVLACKHVVVVKNDTNQDLGEILVIYPWFEGRGSVHLSNFPAGQTYSLSLISVQGDRFIEVVWHDRNAEQIHDAEYYADLGVDPSLIVHLSDLVE